LFLLFHCFVFIVLNIYSGLQKCSIECGRNGVAGRYDNLDVPLPNNRVILIDYLPV